MAVLPTVRMPCLLYAGEMDEAYPLAKKFAMQIANATFFTLPGLNHMGAIMRSDEVLPHVKRFLAEVGDPKRYQAAAQWFKLAGIQPAPNTSSKKQRSQTPLVAPA
jgi:hypothetical protein